MSEIRAKSAAALAAVAMLATACSGSTTAAPEGMVISPADTPPAYDGPLQVAVPKRDTEDPLKSAAAAVRALQCEGKPYEGGVGSEWGTDGGGNSAVDGLRRFLDDVGSDRMPRHAYTVEREEAERVLYSFDVGGRTKVAVIIAKDGDPLRPGWGAETWAQCDPAEFPGSLDDELGVRVWSDTDGRRVPATKVHSFPGPSHCDWQDVEFLYLGERQYLRDPAGKLPADMLRSTFAEGVQLPADGTDTGYRLDGRHLWLAGDGSSAYVQTGAGVERWPGAREPIACR